MDYYQTLKVSKAASQDEIKAAYKKLAFEHHPDHGGDATKFSSITEAYTVLGDSRKRSEYDSQQSREFVFRSADVDNLFKNYQPNQDIVITETISFADQFTGKIIDLSYSLPDGQIKNLSAEIPKGIRDNQRLTFTGYGSRENPHVKPGNLIIRVKVQPDDAWQRTNQDDIRTTIKMNAVSLILGGTFEIKIPTGKEYSVNIKKGTQSGTVLNLTQCGIPNITTGIQGNVLLDIQAVIPEIEDQEVLDLLAKVESRLKD